MRILNSIAFLLLMGSVLLSSTGVRLSQHWCGENLVSAAFFGEAKPCSHFQAKTSEKPPCPFHAKQGDQKKCCDQREAIVNGNDYDYEVQVNRTPVPVQAISTILSLFHSIVGSDQDRSTPKYLNHSPPLIGSDVFVRIQSFLL